MQRFIITENIRRYEQQLAHGDLSPADTPVVRELLADARQELTDLLAREAGAMAEIGPADARRRSVPGLATAFEASDRNQILLDPGCGLHIVEVSAAYAEATLVRKSDVLCERLFDVFPDNPDDPAADGVSNLFASLQAVVNTRRPHHMPIQRYDVRDAEGHFVVRYWLPVNIPVLAPSGHLAYIMHQANDVTASVLRP